jgi:4a-hydroxytetrahydrobiopterin dehydratase
LAFINQVGEVAERLNHHPDIHNSWNRVTLSLYTHDAGGQVTEKDLTLARAIQSISLP